MQSQDHEICQLDFEQLNQLPEYKHQKFCIQLSLSESSVAIIYASIKAPGITKRTSVRRNKCRVNAV